MIHPPLPLSRRDSQHLLSILNTSFDEALDKKHPIVSSEGKNSTDHHVHSILSSPMFGSEGTKGTTQPENNHSIWKSDIRKNGLPRLQPGPRKDSVSLAHDMIEWDVQRFRRHVAAGKADPVRAIACLQGCAQQLRAVSERHGIHATCAFKSHGIGSMILNWLWSSGLHDSDEILLNRNFMRPMALFLALEGNIEQSMQWFERLSTKAVLLPCPMKSTHSLIRDPMAIVEQSQATLMSCLLQADASLLKYRDILGASLLSKWPGAYIRPTQGYLIFQSVLYALVNDTEGSLKNGIRLFLQAVATSKINNEVFYERSFVFSAAGNLIVSHIEDGEANRQVEPSIYDAFSQAVHLWSRATNLILAILELHHPSKPSSKHAYVHLKWLTPSHIQLCKPIQRRRIMRLGLDTAGKLLSDATPRSVNQAKQVMEILQENFGHELGVLKSSSDWNCKSFNPSLIDVKEGLPYPTTHARPRTSRSIEGSLLSRACFGELEVEKNRFLYLSSLLKSQNLKDPFRAGQEHQHESLQDCGALNNL